tara:strand:+ start:6390 stop:7664 length:1275 start_codon:yes stop_codon:yes gene_type:complete
MGGSRTVVQQPELIDPGEAQGKYLFGQDFTSYQGVTDPDLQARIIGSEERFRPRYAALELQDISTFAYGLEGGVDSDAYKEQSGRLNTLRAIKEAGGQPLTEARIAQIADDQIGSSLEEDLADLQGTMKTVPKSGTYSYIDPETGEVKTGEGKNWAGRGKYIPVDAEFLARKARRESTVESVAATASTGYGARDLDMEIAEVEGTMTRIAESKGTPGLFDMLEESGKRGAAMQRESLAAQRADDVAALEQFAPQVVEAYRTADPASTQIAEMMSRRAMGDLTAEEERNIQQRARMASASRGRLDSQSSIAREVLGRSDYTAQFAQPAFAMNRAIAGDVGATILGRPSQGLALGANVLGQAQAQASGPMGPQLFDPNVGINMALQQRSQDMTLQGAQIQADATRSAGRSQMMGNLFGGFMGGGFL